jgi:predicted porin
MKKLLIASAALAMVAGTAQAQSSVTVYGSIDAGYSSVESKASTAGGAATKTTNSGIAQSSDVSSRWGLRGSEDLGGGMKANFNVETSLGSGTNGALNGNTTDNGSTRTGAAYINTATVGNRAMWAGISTAGGLEVRAGLQNQFIRDAALASAADGTTNVVGNLLAGNSSVFADRHNAISVTQTMGAVKVGAAMTGRTTEKDATKDVDTGKGYKLMANYAAGNVALGGAYRKVDNTSNIIAAADQQKAFNKAEGINLVADAFADLTATGTETETTVINASYNFGPVKAFAGYGTQDIKTTSSGAKSEREVMTFGVNGNVNAKTQLFATYSTGETKTDAAAKARDIDGYVVGARYSLSKRTTAYAVFGESDVDSGSGTGVADNTKTTQYAVGLNHAF